METTIYEIDFLGNGGLKPVQDAILEIGQIFFLNGYGQNEYGHERIAIYAVQKSSYDNKLQYKYVNLDKPQKGIVNAWEIKPISKKFGIGFYYFDNQFATPEEITEALQLANDAELRKEDLERINKIESDLIRERGRELIEANKPEGEPLGFIIAEYEENESDPMSDYYGSKTTRTVVLAWTFKKRDDFNEMRKACLNCDIEEIRKYGVKPTVDSNGKERTESNKDWWTPADEQRENYSGGAGNYLGHSRYSGWVIRKDCYHKPENFYYAAGKDNGFYAFKPAPKAAKVEDKAVQAVSQAEPTTAAKTDGLQAIDYSDKAFAIFGNTKEIKDTLKELGGRFNPALTHPETGLKQAGWIFSKKLKEAILKELGL